MSKALELLKNSIILQFKPFLLCNFFPYFAMPLLSLALSFFNMLKSQHLFSMLLVARYFFSSLSIYLFELSFLEIVKEMKANSSFFPSSTFARFFFPCMSWLRARVRFFNLRIGLYIYMRFYGIRSLTLFYFIFCLIQSEEREIGASKADFHSVSHSDLRSHTLCMFSVFVACILSRFIQSHISHYG